MRTIQRGLSLALIGLFAGCGTTRMTDTQRTATEQLLVSNAVDQAVSQMDVSSLAGKTVYFDAQYLDGVVDKGYLVSTLRQHMLANGCLLQEDRAKAEYVVEARSGGVGTNRSSLLVGVPQMNVPTFVPGQPSFIPEIPLAKKTDQEGIAKIGVFAYNRKSGQPLWQSGVVQCAATAKDTWVLGAGPFQQGTIRKGTEFAGEPLPTFGTREASDALASTKVRVTESAVWPESLARMTPDRSGILTSAGPVLDSPFAPITTIGKWHDESRMELGIPWTLISPFEKNATSEAAPPPFTPPPPPSKPSGAPSVNAGGQAETEPSKVVASGIPNPKPDDMPDADPKVVGGFANAPFSIDASSWYGAVARRTFR